MGFPIYTIGQHCKSRKLYILQVFKYILTYLMLFQFWIQSTFTQMFSRWEFTWKTKSKPQYSRVALHSYPMLEMAGAERGHEPASDFLGADTTQLQVHAQFSPQPAFLNSLGCQSKKPIFSCRIFWPEASLNGAYFGLAFFYLLWDR